MIAWTLVIIWAFVQDSCLLLTSFLLSILLIVRPRTWSVICSLTISLSVPSSAIIKTIQSFFACLTQNRLYFVYGMFTRSEPSGAPSLYMISTLVGSRTGKLMAFLAYVLPKLASQSFWGSKFWKAKLTNGKLWVRYFQIGNGQLHVSLRELMGAECRQRIKVVFCPLF